MPAAYTPALSGQVSDFEVLCLLIQRKRLLCDSCSSGQCFAIGFLPTNTSRCRSCPSANSSPCRASNRLSSISINNHCRVSAPCRAHTKKGTDNNQCLRIKVIACLGVSPAKGNNTNSEHTCNQRVRARLWNNCKASQIVTSPVVYKLIAITCRGFPENL